MKHKHNHKFAYLVVIQISLFNLHPDATAEEFGGITYVAIAVQCTYIRFLVSSIVASPRIQPFKLSKEKRGEGMINPTNIT